MKQLPWTPELSVTKERAVACIKAQFPALSPISRVVYIDRGFDNTVFLINNRFIFRFPHKAEAHILLQRETNVLEKLKGLFELSIPDPCYIGKPSELFPYMFHGYEKLEGSSGCYAQLTDEQRRAAIIPLAHFLKTLHSVTDAQAHAWGVGPQLYDKSLMQPAVASLRERAQLLEKQGLISAEDKAFLAQEIHLVETLVMPKQPKVLVHGDLYSKHMLFSNGVLTGIIDWGDVGINHPVVDFGVIHGFFPPDCYQSFFGVYGPVDPTVWAYARFIAVRYAYTFMLYAHNAGDAGLERDAKESRNRLMYSP